MASVAPDSQPLTPLGRDVPSKGSFFAPTGFETSIGVGIVLSSIIMLSVGSTLGLFWVPLSVVGLIAGIVYFIQGLFKLDTGIHGRPFLLGKLVGGDPFGNDMRGGFYWRIPVLVQVRTIDMKPFSFEVRERASGREQVPSLPTKDGDVRIFMTVQAMYTDSFKIFLLDASIRDTGLNDAILGALREELQEMNADKVRTMKRDGAVENILTYAQDRIDSPERMWPFRILSIDLDDVNLPQSILNAMERERVEERQLTAEKVELDGVNARAREMVIASRAGGFEIDGADAYDNVADERGKMQGRTRIRIPGLENAARAFGQAIGEALRGDSTARVLPKNGVTESEEGSS